MNLFKKNQLAWNKIVDWSEREKKFVNRTAFLFIACLAWHAKKESDEKLIELLPVIIRLATDERNFVKKAVNWVLRNIGKRNLNLNKTAINTARKYSSSIQRLLAGLLLMLSENLRVTLSKVDLGDER